MAMKTSIRKDSGALIVSLEGHLDFETTDSFRQNLLKLEEEAAKNQRVIFDLSDLHFVGSSGISAFIQALREFNSRAATKPRYTNVKNEFKRIISAFDDTGSFEFCETTERALRSVDN
ncbi:MAG: STAS domain-containing protein [Bdellovibrionota bacterium]